VQINLKDYLLLAKGHDGLAAWDRSTRNNDKDILETLWGWGTEVQVNLEDDLYLSQRRWWTNCLGQRSILCQKIVEALRFCDREVKVNLKTGLL